MLLSFAIAAMLQPVADIEAAPTRTQLPDENVVSETAEAVPVVIEDGPDELIISIPKLTVVDIEILTPLNSKTSKIGEIFDIRLAKPILVDGEVAVPAGAAGKGEVIHAARARAAGKAGEMILTANYVEHDGQTIKLRSFKHGPSTGVSKADEAIAAGFLVAAPLTLFISGKNINVPAGARAHAKTAEKVQLIKATENGETQNDEN